LRIRDAFGRPYGVVRQQFDVLRLPVELLPDVLADGLNADSCGPDEAAVRCRRPDLLGRLAEGSD
jgi:hypothetical protein